MAAPRRWRYAGRLAQHFATDLIWAPLADAASARTPDGVLRAIVVVPVLRIAEAVQYKLQGAKQGHGRPVPQRTWDYEYKHDRWALLDSVEAVSANMVIVGYVYRLFPEPKVLDVGCGTGALADLLHLVPGASYTGVDLSVEAISLASARDVPNARFVQGAMEEWAPAEPYDAIIFNQTIYYTRDPAALLQRYAAWLTERGAFIVAMPQTGNARAMWKTIEQSLSSVAVTTVITSSGHTTDIRVLRPPSGVATA